MPIENKTADNSTEIVAPSVNLPSTGVNPAQPVVIAPADTTLVSPLVTITGEPTNLVGTATSAPEGLIPNTNVPQIPVGNDIIGNVGEVAPSQVDPVTGGVVGAATPAIAAPVTKGDTADVAGPATTVEGVSPTATTDSSSTAPEGAPVVKPTKAPQTTAEKIAAKRKQLDALNKEIERLEARERAGDLLGQVKAGSVIVARVGRAETSREVTASVVGVQTLDNGDSRYKIFFGEGVDAELVVIQSSQILDVKQA